MSLLDAICCTHVFPPPAHPLLSLRGLWDCKQQFSNGWCSSSVMKMICDHELQRIGKKCLHPDSSCRTGPTSYLLLWLSKLLSWLNTQKPESLLCSLALNCISSPLQHDKQKIWKMQNSYNGTSWRNQILLVPPQCTATLRLSAWPCIHVNNFYLLPT